MNPGLKRLLLTGSVAIAATGVARAEYITYDISSTVANTLTRMGAQFIWGCSILAFGIVAAAFVLKKK